MESKMMEFSTNYCEQFNLVLQSKDILFLKDPVSAIQMWQEFIDEILDGYHYCPPEFDYDLQNIRPQIELMLRSSVLNSLSEHTSFIDEIERLDNIYRDCTMENPAWKAFENRYWFKNRVLKFAGKEYADFINSHFSKKYGIVVKSI
ncbi:hypothetical protein D3C80_1441050 [compost metagenome]